MKDELRAILRHARTLTGFSAEDQEVLREARDALLPLGDALKQSFYDALYAYGPAAAVFRDLPEQRADREATLKRWFEQVVSGDYDDAFWEWQWFVGLVHIQHHVSMSFMMGMMSHVQSVLLRKCWELFEDASAERVFGAVLRLTSCIAIFMAEGYHQQYLDAIERAGLKRPLVDRMVTMEVKGMMQEFRRKGNG
jgi:Protoglobin